MHFSDFHIDTLRNILYANHDGDMDYTFLENKGHVDLKRLRKSDYAAQIFACFTNIGKPSLCSSYFDEVLQMIDVFYNGIKGHEDIIRYAGSYEDYKKNMEDGVISGFISTEGGGYIENDLDRLNYVYDRGVRFYGIIWNNINTLGYPNHEWTYQHEGLKPFGLEAIERCDELGLVIDVSHLNDGGFEDIIKYGKRPFMATHSNARALRNHPRNLSDDMIKKLANKGGLAGLNFYSAFLTDNGKSSIEAMIAHIKHFINVGGSEIIGLGTDFDGIPSEGLEIENCGQMNKLVQGMQKAGFSTGQIEDICYLNFEKFLKRYDLK